MLEQLRMQEVTQIILSVSKGAIIGEYLEGEPILIVEKPGLSNLNFISRYTESKDGNGHVSTSGTTKYLDFVINDGTVLFNLWSYIYGKEMPIEPCKLKGYEYIELKNNILKLGGKPSNLFLYEDFNNKQLISPTKYEVLHEAESDTWMIQYNEGINGNSYLAVYDYEVTPQKALAINQLQNNLLCSMDIYIDAVNVQTDDRSTVCIHCDKVQVNTDLNLSVNNSHNVSFTPISIKSIPNGDGINKEVATIMVI